MAPQSAVPSGDDLEGDSELEEQRRSLTALGVSRSLLSEQQQYELDEQGFVILPDMLGGDQLAALSRRFDELVAEEGDQAGTEVHQEVGTDRLANLVNKDAIFDVCWTHPRLLAAVGHIFGWRPFKLNSLNARAPLPGQGHQRLHSDAKHVTDLSLYQACNSVWMLDDFTEQNGATRVVPGSHRWDKVPSDLMEDPSESHPDEMLLLGPAGTCAIFNAHLWHGGTTNRTDRLRRSVMGAFVPRDVVQQTVQRDSLSTATITRLNGPQKYLLQL